jgi:sigma-B regulation protein RsbU (phosphoserine phosphatase)
VKRRYPSHLRLHVEDSVASLKPSSDRSQLNSLSGLGLDEIQEVLKAFSDVTSWAVCDRPKQAESRKEIPGHHLPPSNTSKRWRLVETMVQDGRLETADLTDSPSIPMDRAQLLLSSIERLVDRLDLAEETVRRQEAELATAVGVTSHSDRQRETADRLESILDSVGRSIGAVAGAIYLLDDDTSTLKMRSSIGLPKTRLTAPPRELRGSLADLEALLGNAVLLSDIEMMRDWPSPEPFASALVVPIGSSTMPHGTMWFWSENTRSYSATEVEVANLAAGRVMSEIEQSILGQEIHQSRAIQKQFDTASLTQASMLPDSQILHEDFDVNGWTFQNSSIGGGFHHWDINPHEMMTLAIGNASQQGPDGAIVATGIQSIVRTLWQGNGNPVSIMRSINDTLWGMQEADWTASVGLIQINPATGYGSICSAGDIQSFIVSHRGFRPIGSQGTRVATQPDTVFSSSRFNLQPGEILLSFTSGMLRHSTQVSLPKGSKKGTKPFSYATLDQNSLLQIIKDMADEKASDIAGFLARTLPTFDRDNDDGSDRSLILVKNIRKAIK